MSEEVDDKSTHLRILLDGDGAFADFGSEAVMIQDGIRIAALARGTSGGNPTVVVGFRMPDGKPVLVQTTMKLFLAAANAFAAKYALPWDAVVTNIDGKTATVMMGKTIK